MHRRYRAEAPASDKTFKILYRFLSDLEENFENNIFSFQVCDVVLNHAPDFRRVYLPYVTNQTYQERTFQSLM